MQSDLTQSEAGSTEPVQGLIEKPPSSDTDPRVHYDQRTGKWAYEDDDGTEMEWNPVRGAWVPVVEDDLIAKQQAAYSVAGVDESAPTPSLLARDKKKRKAEATAEGDSTGKNGRKASKPARAPRPNTAVYVTSLPPTTTLELLQETFSKAGLILEDGDGVPRIKLYRDEQGRFKGDALVVYFQPASVELAVRLFDETELVLGSGDGVMKVREAKWDDKQPGDSGQGEGGSGSGPSKPQRSEAEKQKMAKKAEKLRQKLTDWSSSDDEATLAIKRNQPPKRNPRVVVLSYMFTLQELEEDPTLLLDLKEDVRDECEKTCGEVTNVTLYDKEPDGIMTVRFKDEIAAQACIVKMHKRFFGGRSITAALLDSSKKYRKSGQGADVLAGTGFEQVDEEEEREEQERMDKYQKWLEAGGETPMAAKD